MSGMNHSREILDNGWLRLQQQQRITFERWNDPVSDRFERDYWQDFDRILSATLAEMDKLAQVIAQARRSVK